MSRGRTRVVSLVPSLTEAVAVSAPGLLVGVTDWCTGPGGPDPRRPPPYGGPAGRPGRARADPAGHG
ncbi:helical backbone metal receptor, partial [Streptomyces sp. NPDC001193]